MVININLIRDNTRKWFFKNENGAEIWVIGFAFINNDLYSEGEFVKILAQNIDSSENTIEVLKKISGSFAFVIKKENIVIAAVDMSRTMPLFYSYQNNKIFISDDAYWVRDKVGDTKIDPLAEGEFFVSGMISGKDTLYANTKQLQAAEILFTDTNSGKIDLKSYHSFIFTGTSKDTIDEFLLRYDEVLLNVFKRMIKWLNGRTAVVPLSGGYDSRLIVLMLKRLNYEKIITFTFGRPGNNDSVKSEKVAKQLGVPWKYVEYNNDLWYEWFHSEERKKYYRFSDGVCTLPVFTLLPAVKELKKQNVFPKDSVFIQGHTIVTLTHQRVADIKDKNMLIDEVKRQYYALWPFDTLNENIANSLTKKISDLLDNYTSSDWYRNASDSWLIKERIAKLTVNSVRVFEFLGYEWYLPYLDREFVEFCESVPLDLRIDRKLYIMFVNNLYNKYLGLNTDGEDGLKSKIKAKIDRKSILFNPLKYTYKLLKYIYDISKPIFRIPFSKKNMYYQHPWASYGIMRKKQFDKLYTGEEVKFAFHTLEYLGKIKYD